MSARGPVERPSGMPPPSTVALSDGRTVDLATLASEITALHLARHPEDRERYGPELAEAWCQHDNQHMLAWALADLDLGGQLAWLARLLDARGYPVRNLIDCVGACAEVVDRRLSGSAGAQAADRLRAAAQALELV